MSKLERNTIRLITFGMTESPQGKLRITSLNVQGSDKDTNQTINITSIPEEDEEILTAEVGELIKRIIRYQYMEANN